jgi:hypothetical protein
MPFKAVASRAVHLEEQRGVLRLSDSGRKYDGCKKQHSQATYPTKHSQHLARPRFKSSGASALQSSAGAFSSLLGPT